MSEMKHVRVFILGAGCSANCEYPLGIDLTRQLQKFALDIPTDCTRIKQSVSDTITLMRGLPAIETLDQLAKQIDDDFLAWSAQRGSMIADRTCLDKERLANKQILDAKVAISAMFVVREENARRRGLPGYHRLLEFLFEGEPWQEAVGESDCHVLSFNYDRLFEIAFLDRFNTFPWQQHSVYGESALNSGFNSGDFDNSGYEKVQLTEGRFCFLKLHGSADWWVKKRAGNRSNPDDELRHYWPRNPNKASVNLHEFEEFLRKQWEPLIAFPHEKQRAVKRQTDFLADRYLEKTEAHAVSVLANATEVKIIGYSFAQIDGSHVVNNLLNKVPEDAKIIVRNTDITTVKSRLEEYPTLRKRVEFDPTPF